MSILELKDLSYAYEDGVPVLEHLNYSFEEGRIYAIVGRSGAGKTTLLSLLSGLASPTSGSILFEGKDIRSIDKYRFRSQNVGVIFQSFNLLPNLTAEENVILSMEIAGMKLGNKRLLARDLLEKVGLDSREISRRILKLSGGQQQRVAIARALAYDPHIILADEPTGNLDGEIQEEIMEIFRHLAHQEGRCIIIVTHSPAIAEESDEVFRLARETGRKKQPTKREAPAKTEEPSQATASPEKTDSPAPSRTDTPVIFSPPPARSSRPASKRPHEISRKVISRQEEKEYQEALQSFLNAQPVEKKRKKKKS